MEKLSLKRRANGLSLIEVLVSLVLLNLILLSFYSIEIYAMRENRKAYFFSVAENQLNSLAELLRTHTEIDQQILIWNKQNQQLLPQGKGFISGNFPDYRLKLTWNDNQQNSLALRVQL